MNVIMENVGRAFADGFLDGLGDAIQEMRQRRIPSRSEVRTVAVRCLPVPQRSESPMADSMESLATDIMDAVEEIRDREPMSEAWIRRHADRWNRAAGKLSECLGRMRRCRRSQ